MVAEGDGIDGYGSVVGGDIGVVATLVGGVLHAGHGAVVVVVAGEGTTVVVAFVVVAADGTMGVLGDSGNGGADGEVVGQGTRAVVVACDGSVIIASCAIVRDGEGGCAGAMRDCCIVVACDTAVIICFGLNCMDGDIGCDVAACDGASVMSCDTSDMIPASDTGIGEGEVVDGATAGYKTEESLIIIILGMTAALIDTDATDGLVLPSKLPSKYF